MDNNETPFGVGGLAVAPPGPFAWLRKVRFPNFFQSCTLPETNIFEFAPENWWLVQKNPFLLGWPTGPFSAKIFVFWEGRCPRLRSQPAKKGLFETSSRERRAPLNGMEGWFREGVAKFILFNQKKTCGGLGLNCKKISVKNMCHHVFLEKGS